MCILVCSAVFCPVDFELWAEKRCCDLQIVWENSSFSQILIETKKERESASSFTKEHQVLQEHFIISVYNQVKSW